MIIYGWNTKTIKQAPLQERVCPQCQQKESVLVIMAHYAHLFWIPVFPYKKSATIVCVACNHQTEADGITLGANVTVKQLKATVPLPKYLFTGLVLLVVGIGFFIYSLDQDTKLEASYIENPEVGDVYVIKNENDTSQYNYYLVKVRDVHGDSIWISYSSYLYNGIVSQLDPNDGFYNIMYPVHRKGIKDYHDSGELIKVMRDYSATAGFDREIEFQEPDSVSGASTGH